MPESGSQSTLSRTPKGRGTDLAVLLVLLALSTALYFVVGPAGLSAIISAGVGLYVAWRGKR